MHEVYAGHGFSRVECCSVERPCLFHERHPDAIRSPHVAVNMEMTSCADCTPSMRRALDADRPA